MNCHFRKARDRIDAVGSARLLHESINLAQSSCMFTVPLSHTLFSRYRLIGELRLPSSDAFSYFFAGARSGRSCLYRIPPHSSLRALGQSVLSVEDCKLILREGIVRVEWLGFRGRWIVAYDSLYTFQCSLHLFALMCVGVDTTPCREHMQGFSQTSPIPDSILICAVPSAYICSLESVLR